MCGILALDSDEYSLDTFNASLGKLGDRGPDMTRSVFYHHKTFGFDRLAIMDLSPKGMQPFENKGIMLVCNGEIYNYPALKKTVGDYPYRSSSDCEVLIPLYEKFGFEIMCKYLDAEFALAMYDSNTGKFMAARDPMGIRPMFYGYTKGEHKFAVASEAKALFDLCDGIFPFPPGHYYDGEKFVCYNDLGDTKLMNDDDLETIAKELRERLISGVEKRLQSDAPVGYLLSGGLDSSLVCSIGQRITDKPIRTFAIGMETDPIDLKYAKEVAEYLGTEHTEVIMTKDDVLNALREVIYHLETWDITTIRASIGMYLLCHWIHKNTDIKVIMTGEVSDELFGYKYTDFAPSPEAFQEESQKRIRELYMYDVLRADRCISANALEGRVPFADLRFVDYAMAINPDKKMNHYNKGKYLLRHADDILFREKAAFSDAVGHSMVDYLKAYAEKQYTDEDVAHAKEKYPYGTPFTKESLLYRDIFEEFYPGGAKWIKDFWMPNKSWENCDVDDPSARVLKNYGDSGK